MFYYTITVWPEKGKATTTHHEFQRPAYAAEHAGIQLSRPETKAVSITRISQEAYREGKAREAKA
jgi:hypothetical protein